MKSTSILAGTLAAVLVSAAAWAADNAAQPAKDAEKPPAAAPAAPAANPAQPGMPAMTPEQQKMMEMYMKASTPGPEHARLARAAGSWDMVVTSWEGPGAPPHKDQGTAEISMMLGGRVQMETVKSQMMGGPFEGTGMNGFDNVSKKYWSIWMDSMSTGPMISWGTCESESSCSYAGTMNDAATGKSSNVHFTVKRDGADKMTMEMFGAGPDGKDMKMLEILYTRRK